ncbi:unnamed protein product [Parnassius apollo]|uniref:(apollo) hypothetical protein n=1 Tax=Parnassius apollo TaxID=110799 RepID=A0A8S3XAY7_PARAO|nr:unnamed protein product [Parnassius apollo]
MKFLFILFLFFCDASAVIYRLNNTEYVRMPPLHHLDPYELCVYKPKGLYCTVEIDLVSDGSTDEGNELMEMIKEYSARTETHYNHTRLHHGICVTDMCQEYLAQKTTEDLKVILEGCLNSSFWEKYRLKTRINEDLVCNHQDETFELEPGDIGVAMMVISLVVLNISGIIYDCFTLQKKDHEVNKLLRCFSIRRNWLKLVAPVANGNERRFKRLKSFNGLRAITIFLVITEHALLPFLIASDNTLFFEEKYHNILYHLYFDGTIIVQIFFIISGCLLAYYLQVWSEKKDLSWKMIPKGILARWLRLTPSYAIVLAISLTWLRFFGSGPLWGQVVNSVVKDCRRYGWLHLIYINNYIDNSLCMTHSWYLAADMQLYIFGLVLLILVQREYARKVVLSVMFVIALIIPAFHTYIQNLNAYFIAYPESTRFYFVADPTFNNTYKRGHTNLANYILGLGLGLLIHKMQKEKFNIKKYRKFKFVYWAIVPVGIGVILCSGLFYMDGVSPPLLLKAVYSGLVKPVFGFITLLLILGMVFKMENIYRGIFEWQGWTSPARVSYSAYIIHMLLIRSITGSRTTLIHITLPYIIIIQVGTGILCYLVAFPFWLLIEAPLSQLVNLIMPLKDSEKMKSNTKLHKIN